MNKTWGDRFGDAALVAFVVVLFTFGALWVSWQAGHQAGWTDGMNEYARQNGGVWMQVTIGDKTLQGYMR